MKLNYIFAEKIISWHLNKKNQDLFPWQLNKTIYNVWISEIMLQQTQVSTVISYYLKFIKNFPTLLKLAESELNTILFLWSGLGYYQRAINLHKTAKIIVNNYSGQFPKDFQILISLPGIGKSTAGAILSLALNQRYPILDGNIKRILIRYYQITSKTLTESEKNKKLWFLINQLMPHENISIFNQAMMDLGRIICTYKNPKCKICPINQNCQSFLKNTTNQYPALNINPQTKIKKTIWWLILLIKINKTVWLINRSQEKIWKKLFCFPEFYSYNMLNKWIMDHFLNNNTQHHLVTLKHYISNLNLNIQPVLINLNSKISITENTGIWYNLSKPEKIGIPKPVYLILEQLKNFHIN